MPPTAAKTGNEEFISFVKEIGQIEDLLSEKKFLSTQGGNDPDEAQVQICDIIESYQEQCELLDPHLEAIISKLIGYVVEQLHRDRVADSSGSGQSKTNQVEDVDMVVVNRVFKVVYVLAKVRGYKTVVKFFPHEVSDLEPTLALLAAQQLNAFETWHARYGLLLWLSIIVMIPFSLKSIDSTGSGSGSGSSSSNGPERSDRSSSNVMKWHVNIDIKSCSNPSLADSATFHFLVAFPGYRYPVKPPVVFSGSPLPLECVSETSSQWAGFHGYRVNLPMFTQTDEVKGLIRAIPQQTLEEAKQCKEIKSWSPSLSAKDVVSQLQNLVTCALQTTNAQQNNAPYFQHARSFVCSGCSHTNSAAFPATAPASSRAPLRLFENSFSASIELKLNSQSSSNSCSDELEEHCEPDVERMARLTVSGGATSSFACLPHDVLVGVLTTYLTTPEVTALSFTCKLLWRVCQDGHIWRRVLSFAFPGSQTVLPTLNPLCLPTQSHVGSLTGGRDSWRRMFLMEAHRILSSLSCFFTKKDFFQDVLGVPLTFTVTSRTGDVNFIHSTMDIISAEAFFASKLRRTKSGEEFTEFLPLYFTREHFLRGLPILQETIFRLSQNSLFRSKRKAAASSAQGFDPIMVLDVLPKILSTLTVLLVDRGVDASNDVCQGFVAIHRLFLALCTHYPALQREVEKRISEFVQNEKARIKPKVKLSKAEKQRQRLNSRVCHPAAIQCSTTGSDFSDATLADRLKREKAKGGQIVVSLMWNDFHDLDLHVVCPNGDRIYHGNRRCSGGELDVDMNAGGEKSKEPVENVFFANPANGKYCVFVENYSYHHQQSTTDLAAVPFRCVLQRKASKSEINEENPDCSTSEPEQKEQTDAFDPAIHHPASFCFASKPPPPSLPLPRKRKAAGAGEVEQQVHNVRPSKRTKRKRSTQKLAIGSDEEPPKGCAALGDFVILLAVSREWSWEQVAPFLLEEAFDRKVFWICRRFPELAELESLPESLKDPGAKIQLHADRQGGQSVDEPVQAAELEVVSKLDNGRLYKARQHVVLEGGVLVFSIFLVTAWQDRVISTPAALPYESHPTYVTDSTSHRLDQLAAHYDRFFGRPSTSWMECFRKEVANIHAISSWDEYFQKLGLCPMSPLQLLHFLRQCVRNSRRKRYHDENTDFVSAANRVSSNILLRGGVSTNRTVFVIDTSGSMGMWMNDPELGNVSRLEYVQNQLCDVLQLVLTPNQLFSVISFSCTSKPLFDGFLRATANNIQFALSQIRSWRPNGGTNLMAALRDAYALPCINAVYLLSDGDPTVGETSHDAIELAVSQWSVNRTGRVGQSESTRIPCHPTALFADDRCKTLLRKIAEASGGTILAKEAP